MEVKNYVAPEIEVIEVEIEQGFAVTGDGGGKFNVPGGGSNDGGWL